MPTTRSARTVWEGNLLEGKGVVTFDSSGTGERPVPWPSRAAQANGRTSPGELIAAAHSSCFSMAPSNGLTEAGNPPTELVTSADVTFQPGEGITGVHLTVGGTVPGRAPSIRAGPRQGRPGTTRIPDAPRPAAGGRRSRTREGPTPRSRRPPSGMRSSTSPEPTPAAASPPAAPLPSSVPGVRQDGFTHRPRAVSSRAVVRDGDPPRPPAPTAAEHLPSPPR